MNFDFSFSSSASLCIKCLLFLSSRCPFLGSGVVQIHMSTKYYRVAIQDESVCYSKERNKKKVAQLDTNVNWRSQEGANVFLGVEHASWLIFVRLCHGPRSDLIGKEYEFAGTKLGDGEREARPIIGKWKRAPKAGVCEGVNYSPNVVSSFFRPKWSCNCSLLFTATGAFAFALAVLPLSHLFSLSLSCYYSRENVEKEGENKRERNSCRQSE